MCVRMVSVCAGRLSVPHVSTPMGVHLWGHLLVFLESKSSMLQLPAVSIPSLMAWTTGPGAASMSPM